MNKKLQIKPDCHFYDSESNKWIWAYSTDLFQKEILSTQWVNIEDNLPEVKSAPGFGEYYESRLVLVAFLQNEKISYEVAKYTKGRDTVEGGFWESWYVPQADDVVENVIGWLPFSFYS